MACIKDENEFGPFTMMEFMEKYVHEELWAQLDELSSQPQSPEINKRIKELREEAADYIKRYLSRGQAIAFGRTINFPLNEPSIRLHPSAWDTLQIRWEPKAKVFDAFGFQIIVKIYDLEFFKQNDRKGSGCAHNVTFDGAKAVISLGEQTYVLSGNQAKIVRKLFESSTANEGWVHWKVLKTEGIRSNSMRDVFRSRPEWKEYIESNGSGKYRLKVRSQNV